mmetsp:Transcript_1327/g.5282  ORF Transcript_1327/g.5282 Transcript_1327/m.5282 type:complete len:295 (+) Transcript_1327:732-1616(+)
MRTRVVHPVYARQLGVEPHPAARERLARRARHALAVRDERAAVPVEEPMPVRRAPAAVSFVGEEVSLPWPRVVPARIVRPAVPPLGHTVELRARLQRAQHVLVVALELANAREGPARVALRIRGEAHFTRGAHAHAHLLYCAAFAQVVRERVPERSAKVGVNVHGRAPSQQRQLVHGEAEVLAVASALAVGEEYVRIRLRLLQHPQRQAHQAAIVDVAAARVEAHHALQLQARLRHQLGELEVGGPVVDARLIALHDAPPHVHHHPFDAHAAQGAQARSERAFVVERVVDANGV